jgi:hypothetical protein
MANTVDGGRHGICCADERMDVEARAVVTSLHGRQGRLS